MPRPKVAPLDARKEMARRHLHVFGPATPASFADWAGIGPRQAKATYDDLDTAGELVAVRTPIADAWILASDEKCFRSPDQPTDVVPTAAQRRHLLPAAGADRDLLLPDPQRAELWTSRVRPGALLIGDEIVGTWRRASAVVSVKTWRTLSQSERQLVESEAQSLPLPVAGKVRLVLSM